MSAQILSPQDINEISSTPKFRAGTYMQDWLGRTWGYFQASVALVQGNAIEPESYAIQTGTVETSAAVDTRRIKDTGKFTTTKLVDMAPDTKNGHLYKLWINGGAAMGQGGPIYNRVDNDYVDVYFINSDDGKADVLITTSSTFTVYTLTRVKKATTVHATRVLGFVQRQAGITDEYWFWALVEGEGLGLIDHSETAITGGAPIITSADDGYIEGVNTTTPGAEPFYTCGYGIMDQAATDLVPIVASCIKLGGMQIPPDLDTAYPGLR